MVRPTKVLLGDYNGDGRSDVVVTGIGDNSAEVDPGEESSRLLADSVLDRASPSSNSSVIPHPSKHRSLGFLLDVCPDLLEDAQSSSRMICGPNGHRSISPSAERSHARLKRLGKPE